MAELDQMNVKANEQDTQGTDYDIRDRKLTTATSQQVVNSSDVVLLKDTSGNFHEIAKDSFMSAVRGALGSLIKSYDKGTNINGVAVTGSTGTVNDLGFSSPSDLASVLGGCFMATDQMISITASTPSSIFDDLRKNIIYAVYDQGKIIMPAVFCVLLNVTISVNATQRWCAQFAWSVNTTKLYTRARDENTWRVWKEISLI